MHAHTWQPFPLAPMRELPLTHPLARIHASGPSHTSSHASPLPASFHMPLFSPSYACTNSNPIEPLVSPRPSHASVLCICHIFGKSHAYSRAQLIAVHQEQLRETLGLSRTTWSATPKPVVPHSPCDVTHAHTTANLYTYGCQEQLGVQLLPRSHVVVHTHRSLAAACLTLSCANVYTALFVRNVWK